MDVVMDEEEENGARCVQYEDQEAMLAWEEEDVAGSGMIVTVLASEAVMVVS